MGRQLHPVVHPGGLRHRDPESMARLLPEEAIQEHSLGSRENPESGQGVRGQKEVYA